MTPEERIAHRFHWTEAQAVCRLWRAEVGRLPRAHEARIAVLTERYGLARMRSAVLATRDAGLRRTPARWEFFLALFCEVP